MSGCLDSQYSGTYTNENIVRIFTLEGKYGKHIISEELLDTLEIVFQEASNKHFKSYKDYNKFWVRQRKKHKKRSNLCINKSLIFAHYQILYTQNRIQRNYSMEKFMKNKGARSRSGIISVTIFTSGHLMGDASLVKSGGCPMDCHYCPFEKDSEGRPTQPRSYLSTEPGNKRATEQMHHPLGQTLARLFQLEHLGHISRDQSKPNKIEFIISGGTFNFYPREYIIWFATCAYYACNTYHEISENNGDISNIRPMGTLEFEQCANVSASNRIIGLTIETRPDYVTPKKKGGGIDFSQLDLFREIGVTRVQVGVQSTKDHILKKVNRGCTSQDNKVGIRRLKQNGFKTDIHIMADLPGSTIETDMEVIDEIVSDPDYEADQWKFYPTEVTPFTKIKEWYDDGSYAPYGDDSDKMLDMSIYVMSKVKSYIRLNRVIRDIPHESIIGGVKCSNMRQLAKNKMDRLGITCVDIREREVKNQDMADIKMAITQYPASGGDEYFIQYCSLDETILYGFVRLRLNKSYYDSFKCLNGCALIRELHVFGNDNKVGQNIKGNIQHRGLGKKLLKRAEWIASFNGYKKIAVIVSPGTRGYYIKRGYHLGEKGYMYKSSWYKYFIDNLPYLLIIVAIGLTFYSAK